MLVGWMQHGHRDLHQCVRVGSDAFTCESVRLIETRLVERERRWRPPRARASPDVNGHWILTLSRTNPDTARSADGNLASYRGPEEPVTPATPGSRERP